MISKGGRDAYLVMINIIFNIYTYYAWKIKKKNKIKSPTCKFPACGNIESWVERLWSSESESPRDKNRLAIALQCMAGQAAGAEAQVQACACSF